MTRSPGAWAAGAQGTAGEGPRRVCISQDREPGIWKVGSLITAFSARA